MGRNSARYKDIDKKISAYFALCDSVNTGQKSIVKPYTVSGLINSLGLTRGEFERLASNKKYSGSISAAKAKVEAFIEENALTGGLSSNAAANSLKYNFGWGEKNLCEEISTQTKSIIISLDGDAEILAR